MSLLFFFNIFYGFRSGEVDSVDSLLGTNGNALPAKAAFAEVDIGQVVGHGDSAKRTLLLTLAATDTSGLTSLHGHGTLVLVDTRHEHATALDALLAELDDAARTSLRTGTAGGTLILVNLGQTRLGIQVNGVKLTSSDTVATSQATKAAGRLTGTAGIHGRTGA